MRRTGITAILLCTVVALAGCGEKESLTADTNTIIITEKGDIVGYIAEEFDEYAYSADDLQEMIDAEVDDFNSTASDANVSLKEFSVSDGTAKASLVYSDGDAYSSFNHEVFFYGTVQDAVNAGYDLKVTLQSAANENATISQSELKAMSDSYIVITEDDSNIRSYRNIAYLGTADTLISRTEADTNDEDELHYIVFE